MRAPGQGRARAIRILPAIVLDVRGFTLLEILLSLSLLSIVTIGTLGFLAATETQGLLDTVPTGAGAARTARDYSAASVFLQGFHEFVMSARIPIPSGRYCVGPGCSGEPGLPEAMAGHPIPPERPYQLNWRRLDVVVDRLDWDGEIAGFAEAPGSGQISSGTPLVRVRSTLTWIARGHTTTLTVERFIR